MQLQSGSQAWSEQNTNKKEQEMGCKKKRAEYKVSIFADGCY